MGTASCDLHLDRVTFRALWLQRRNVDCVYGDAHRSASPVSVPSTQQPNRHNSLCAYSYLDTLSWPPKPLPHLHQQRHLSTGPRSKTTSPTPLPSVVSLRPSSPKTAGSATTTMAFSACLHSLAWVKSRRVLCQLEENVHKHR